MTISIITAVSENNVIGLDNKLPWHLPADLKHFKSTTMGHHIIMGRKTFESFGKPLPDRVNIIITRQRDFKAGDCIVVHSLEEAIRAVKNDDEPFICGGAAIYKEALQIANKMYLTRIHGSFEGDTFFPEFDQSSWKEIQREEFEPDERNPHRYSFSVFEREV